MAVIDTSSESGLGDGLASVIPALQALSFMTFVLLYTPCLGIQAASCRNPDAAPSFCSRWSGPCFWRGWRR